MKSERIWGTLALTFNFNNGGIFPLYSLANWINGIAFREIEFTQSGKPVIKIAEMKNGIYSGTGFTEGEFDTRYLITKGDLLFSWSGSPKTSIFPMIWNSDDGWLNQHIFKVVPNEGISKEFMHLLLLSSQRELIFMASNRMTTGLGHVTKSDLERLKINLPNKIERSIIVKTVYPLIQQEFIRNEINDLILEMISQIFRSWFIDFDPVKAKAEGRIPYGMDEETAALFPDSFEDSELGPIPSGWEVKPLSEVSDLYDNLRVPLSSIEREEMKGDYPYYGATSIMDYVDDFLFDGIHLLLAEDGSVVDENGFPVLQYVWGKFWVNNHAHVIRGNGPISTEHLVQYLRHFYILPYVTGAVQLKINQKALSLVKLVVAPTNINQAFNDIIKPLYGVIHNSKEYSNFLKSTRDALLPRLMSGELQVTTEA